MIEKELNYLNITKDGEKNTELGNSTDNSKKLNLEVINGHKTSSYSALDIVKILLRERAMKQTDLAREIGICKQALHNYLKGEWGVPTQIKIKIAQALNVDSAVIWDLK